AQRLPARQPRHGGLRPRPRPRPGAGDRIRDLVRAVLPHAATGRTRAAFGRGDGRGDRTLQVVRETAGLRHRGAGADPLWEQAELPWSGIARERPTAPAPATSWTYPPAPSPRPSAR